LEPTKYTNLRNLIGGKLKGSETSVEILNPSTEKTITHCPMASMEDFEIAVASARDIFPSWSKDKKLRISVLNSIAEILIKNIEILATALSMELGLPYSTSVDEVKMASLFFKNRASASDKVETLYDNEKQKVDVVRKPIGVVGAIIPWNAPLMVLSEKVATSMAMGNTVILKTSPLAPLTCLLFAKIISDCVPQGAISIMCGDESVGRGMVNDKRIGMISFTGSTHVGMQIMAEGAKTLKRLSLELGGNDAAIVLPDVQIEKVVSNIFWGAFYRTGQVCTAIKRLYVHGDIYNSFVDALVDKASSATLGGPFDKNVTLGPVSNKSQFDKFNNIVKESINKGGKVACGGKERNREGYFFEPTVVIDVNPDNPLVVKEQFGPAIPIVKYENINDAVKHANRSDYGLGGSVWGADSEKAEAIACQLEAGTVWVNRHAMVSPDIPFGGFKHSGVGRANGSVGLDSYSEIQTVSVNKRNR